MNIQNHTTTSQNTLPISASPSGFQSRNASASQRAGRAEIRWEPEESPLCLFGNQVYSATTNGVEDGERINSTWKFKLFAGL